MSSTARDMAELISRCLHESAPSGLISAYLFGSHVAGRAHRESDVDVAVSWPGIATRRLVTTGERVFCSDPEQDHAFVRDVQLRAADLDPFLRRTRRLKVAAVRR